MLADRDMIVSVDISQPPILDSKEQDIASPRLSYWQDIIPQQVPEAEFAKPLIVVHTADHPGRVPEFANGPRAQAKGKPENSSSAATYGNAFCGWHPPVSFIRLELSPGYLRRVEAAVGSEPSQRQVVSVVHTHDLRTVQMGAWLLDELHDGGMGPHLYTDSLANLLALHLLRRYRAAVAMPEYSEPSQPLAPEVTGAIEYMRANLDRPISLVDLSQAVHVSPSHLARLFKRSTGLAPHQFLIRIRVDHARELLLSNRFAISEVAIQSGFSDQSHLNRHLKRIYGVTPRAILNRT